MICVSFVVSYMRFGNLSQCRAMNAQASASAQTRLSLRCSYTQGMDVEEGSDKKQTANHDGYVSKGVNCASCVPKKRNAYRIMI